MNGEKLKDKARKVRAKVQRTICTCELIVLTRGETVEVLDGDAQVVVFEHTALEIVEFFAVRS